MGTRHRTPSFRAKHRHGDSRECHGRHHSLVFFRVYFLAISNSSVRNVIHSDMIVECIIVVTCRETYHELKVVVKVRSYFSLVDGEPKRFCGRRTLHPLTVDMHSFSLLQLANHIAKTFSWGSKQYISLWRSLDECVEIKNDEQLLEWCEINLQQGTVHIDAQINDFDDPLQFSPSKRRLHPKVRSTVCEASQTPPINLNSHHDISQPINMRVMLVDMNMMCILDFYDILCANMFSSYSHL
jgi:hypothetical protein